MTNRTKQGLATRALHAGWRSDPATGAFGLPIYLTAAYQFRDSEHAVRLFELEEEGHLYSRLSNPTVAAYEAAVADLEGGVGALATSSGQAAFTHLLAALCSAGDHLVVSRKLYGGTLTLVKNTFARFGVTHTLVDTDEPDQVEGACTPATRAILTETVGNPALNVAPLEELGRIARARDAVLVVDNTFPTPCLCRPIEWGAHVVVHSTTKFLSGQGNVIGGMVVDGGTMDWKASGRWPLLTQPDPSYHGVVFSDRFGPAALAAKLRATLLRDLGGTPSAFDSYLLRQSLGTLPLRMARHSENALTVARYLQDHRQIDWVRYPGLDSHPQRERAKRYLPDGCGGMVACGIRGGVEAGRRFLDALELFGHMANLGDSRSLAIHPASTTHSQLTREERLAGGIEDGLIRLSVGLEDPRDLVEDLDRAFSAAR
ncbi:O-acetylhomoserine sulfhydrolase [Aminomonas paucivorans DSM 12260]|uniref:O-acetylhomoserine sulfhydrolase n=1 Tax=Aminomonas paucivorans DSM 12260 TaxID=584708 RepID=E3CWI0_9BACT|nr:O-acetylhomoserine aminocarboxypropyltransferase/cysteine synthase family protein [Aminomonas paucivorans]EFQ24335.1 O-acetylhomoserine sulfhydrolase [Aminomonas paucivorans DSM 12260]